MVELSLPKDSLRIIEANESLISKVGARSIWNLEIPRGKDQYDELLPKFDQELSNLQ